MDSNQGSYIDAEYNLQTEDQPSELNILDEQYINKKNLSDSEYYKKFVQGQNLLSESQFSGRRDKMKEFSDNPTPVEQQTDILVIRNKVSEMNQIIKSQNMQMQMHEKTISDLQARVQAFQIQNQNLLKEVERNQSKKVEKSNQERLLLQYKEDLQGVRNRVLQEVNLRTRAEQQLEQEKASYTLKILGLEEQKLQITQKTEELRQQERITDQYKSEVQIMKKQINCLEQSLAETKASQQSFKEENQEFKLEVQRYKDTFKHLQLENNNLRKEIDILNGQREKAQDKFLEQRQTISQLSKQNEDLLKNDSITKLKVQLESANSELNKYRSQISEGKLVVRSKPNLLLDREEPNQIHKLSPQGRIQDYFIQKGNDNPILEENLNTIRYQPKYEIPRAYDNQTKQASFDKNYSLSPPKTRNQNTLIVGDKHLQNLEQIQVIENELMLLQQQKNEVQNQFLCFTQLEGQMQKTDTQKIKSQSQLTRRKKLEIELENIQAQIQGLRKNLRNYNALK